MSKKALCDIRGATFVFGIRLEKGLTSLKFI